MTSNSRGEFVRANYNSGSTWNMWAMIRSKMLSFKSKKSIGMSQRHIHFPSSSMHLRSTSVRTYEVIYPTMQGNLQGTVTAAVL